MNNGTLLGPGLGLLALVLSGTGCTYDNAASDTDNTASDTDNTASDTDNTASDTDNTASDADNTASDTDDTVETDSGVLAGCPSGTTDCDGQCIDLETDRLNCGACGVVCAAGEICDGSGVCELSCQEGLEDCGGTCTNLATDRLNCGACGVECAAGEVCDGRGCVRAVVPGGPGGL